jgi:nucleotide-binding universal stress UspA family protein
MTIVCGTDFSEPAGRAVQAAAALAARMNEPLHLVHSLELHAGMQLDEPRISAAAWAKRQLQNIAELARSRGPRVEVHLEEGSPDESLQEVAKRVSARLIVVAALGHRHAGKWQLGSHAERLAQHSHVPVLVVRDAELFAAWTRAERPLRILVGVDLSLSSESALHWIAQLRQYGPCEVIATHLYWPPEQFHRLGLTGVRSYVEPDPEVHKTLMRDFGERMQSVLAPVRLRLEPHLGGLGERLISLAAQEQADLIVVGSHDRDLADRIVHGSVSRDVLHGAQLSVVCVPRIASELEPRLDSVLVATDFSPIGNAAIRLAQRVVATSGTVHVVHVIDVEGSDVIERHDIFAGPDEPLSSAEAAARQQLLGLIPKYGSEAAPATRVHVLRSNNAAEAICQAAERLDAALLCLGTHGRTGMSKTLLGSVAASVLAQTKRHVLLARGPRE